MNGAHCLRGYACEYVFLADLFGGIQIEHLATSLVQLDPALDDQAGDRPDGRKAGPVEDFEFDEPDRPDVRPADSQRP